MTARPNPTHGEADLRPEDYRFEFYFSNKPPLPPFAGVGPEYVEAYKRAIERYDAVREKLRKESSSVYAPVGRCAHCGNRISNHVVLRHVPTGSLVAIGEDCADNRFERSNAEWKSYKADLDRMRALAAQGQKRIKVRERFPEAVALLEECLAEQAARFAGAEDVDETDDDALDAWQRTKQERWEAFRDRWPFFVVDVAEKLARFNDLSEKQTAAVVKAVQAHRERVAKREEERANAKPVPIGRIEVEGAVVSAKLQDGPYGSTLKMLVLSDDGWKVWGTMPRAIEDEIHRRFREGEWDTEFSGGTFANLHLVRPRVRFSATVEASKDDESFGFFKRPTKAEILSNGKEAK